MFGQVVLGIGIDRVRLLLIVLPILPRVPGCHFLVLVRITGVSVRVWRVSEERDTTGVERGGTSSAGLRALWSKQFAVCSHMLVSISLCLKSP